MMYPLLFMLILRSCAALPPLFASPFLEQPLLPSPAFSAFSSLSPLNIFREDTDWLMNIQLPPTGIRPNLPTNKPSTDTGSKTEGGIAAICRVVKDVDGLEFPPCSEIPTDNMKPEDILKNEVKRTTYECKDKEGNEFYMLRTHAVFATNNIHNEQNTANYYSKDKKAITISDLKLDQNKLWEMVDSEEQKEKSSAESSTVASPTSSLSGRSFHFGLPLLSLHPWWSPITSAYQSLQPQCDTHDDVSEDYYPKIEIEKSIFGDEVVDKDTKHETFLCTNPSTKVKYFLLKTTVDVKTKTGTQYKRVQSISKPADEDGNLITDSNDTSGHPKIMSDTLSAVSQSVTSASSKISKKK